MNAPPHNAKHIYEIDT